MKLCKDCVHSRLYMSAGSTAICLSPSNRDSSRFSYYDGTPVLLVSNCQGAREKPYACGPEGNWFQARSSFTRPDGTWIGPEFQSHRLGVSNQVSKRSLGKITLEEL